MIGVFYIPRPGDKVDILWSKTVHRKTKKDTIGTIEKVFVPGNEINDQDLKKYFGVDINHPEYRRIRQPLKIYRFAVLQADGNYGVFPETALTCKSNYCFVQIKGGT